MMSTVLDHCSEDTDASSSSSTSSPTSVTAAQMIQTSFKYPIDSEQPRNISVVENDDDDEDVNDDGVVTSSSVDIYGQKHPIETNEMIRKALRDFDDLLQDHIPNNKKKSVLDAQRHCPELLTDSLKLMFLRCECFKVEVRCNIIYRWSIWRDFFFHFC